MQKHSQKEIGASSRVIDRGATRFLILGPRRRHRLRNSMQPGVRKSLQGLREVGLDSHNLILSNMNFRIVVERKPKLRSVEAAAPIFLPFIAP